MKLITNIPSNKNRNSRKHSGQHLPKKFLSISILFFAVGGLVFGMGRNDDFNAIFNTNNEVGDDCNTLADTGDDFNTLGAAGNGSPEGIWSDGTTMWVLDGSDEKIYAYNMTTKACDSSKNFNKLRNDRSTGIWSDGTTMWVADFSDAKIYAYKMRSKSRDRSKDFNTLEDAGNYLSAGIWSDGTTMWVANYGLDLGGSTINAKIYAYDMTTKERDSSKDFDTLDAENTSPQGIWSDGTTMWVVDSYPVPFTTSSKKIYAYNMITKERDSSKDFNMLQDAGNHHARDIWSDGDTMWVADYGDNKIYAYDMSSYSYKMSEKLGDIAKYFNTLDDAGNDYARDIWSDETTMWVLDTIDDKIYAYKMTTKKRDNSKDFDTLDAENTSPLGIWSDGTTMWVADLSDRIFAYDMTTKERDEEKDFTPNGLSVDIWSDGTTMWGAGYSEKIFAYDMTTKGRDDDKDFDAIFEVEEISSIWSDGTTMWVADEDDRKIYAYNMTTKERDEEKDFNINALQNAGNYFPVGIWSDGTTMWVLDGEDSKIYAYAMGDRYTSPAAQ